MRLKSKRLLPALLAAAAIQLAAQDLAPRAYVITPTGANAITLTWSYYNGGVNFNGTIPITGATGTYNVPIFSYYNSFNFFGHSANFTGSLPYAVGTFSGKALGNERSIYRSGLLDLTLRFSVNLLGGPAMPPQEFAKWKQKTILGTSLKVIAPSGQYDPRKLVNWGINRWAFKPELGYSHRWSNNWLWDAYGGVWFYTTNPASFDRPVPRPQTEEPVGSIESHLSYSFSGRGWASLDGNFWWGGITALSGVRNLDSKQTSSRIGATVSIPFTKHQSLKIAYSDGTYIRFGGNYQNVQVAWQYSWVTKPR
ncbi:MAG: transporter [Acidobacteriaceae bacterium]|nr:transporter [Acidobacteriaceae bacterium]